MSLLQDVTKDEPILLSVTQSGGIIFSLDIPDIQELIGIPQTHIFLTQKILSNKEDIPFSEIKPEIIGKQVLENIFLENTPHQPLPQETEDTVEVPMEELIP